MSERAERLKKSWKSRTSDSLQKARSAINQLIASEEEVTFAAVHKASGVSKNFLYNNAEIRNEIENARKDTHEIAEIKRQKKLKTKQSRDVVLEANWTPCVGVYMIQQRSSSTRTRTTNAVFSGLSAPEHEFLYGGYDKWLMFLRTMVLIIMYSFRVMK